MLLLLLLIAVSTWVVGEIRRLLFVRIVGGASAVVLAFFIGFGGGGSLAHSPMRVQRLQRVALLEVESAVAQRDYDLVGNALREYRVALESGKRQEEAANDLLRALKKTSVN
jgi:hypothetical protein